VFGPGFGTISPVLTRRVPPHDQHDLSGLPAITRTAAAGPTRRNSPVRSPGPRRRGRRWAPSGTAKGVSGARDRGTGLPRDRGDIGPDS
jgi:hypothetical protein